MSNKIRPPQIRECRICDNSAVAFFEDSRTFYLCKNCGLIFTDCPLSPRDIEKHYQNQWSSGLDWNSFARSLLDAVSPVIRPGSVLDFGSGAGLLADAISSVGLVVDRYEPMVHGEFKAEKYGSYDMVILNEVVEHLVDVMGVFDQVCRTVRPGGVIYIGTLMTDAMINEPSGFHELFGRWWYKDDQTHVSFFCQRTFESVCALKCEYELQLLLAAPNGVILRKH